MATSGTFCDLGNGTILDAATGLQWEESGCSPCPGWSIAVESADGAGTTVTVTLPAVPASELAGDLRAAR